MRSFRWVPVTLFVLFVVVRAGRIGDLLSTGTFVEQTLVALTFTLLAAIIWLTITPWPEVLSKFFKPFDVRIASLVLGAIMILAVFAPIASGHHPNTQLDLVNGQLLPPSLAHPFGTDFVSRDLWSRVLFGARVSLMIGVLAVTMAITIGTMVGMAAGYFGGWVELVLMRLVDAGLSIPRVFWLLVIVSLWGTTDIYVLILIIGLTGWFSTSRLVRAEVLRIREEDFVVAARGLGISEAGIVIRQILPNVVPPIIVNATLGIGQVILVEAGLSFLGFGVQPPWPSWGTIIQDGSARIIAAPWIVTVPGVAIALTVVSLAILGDRLQTTLNPRDSAQF